MKKTLLLGVATLLMSIGYAQVDCNIANMQGGFAGGYLGWEIGQGGVYVFIDPANDYAIGESCGASYPYTINTVDFTLADASAFAAGDGVGAFQYSIGIYAVDGGDPCNPPGAQIGSSGTVTINVDGSATYSESVPLGVVVNDAFFVSFEPIAWSGPAGQVPSVLWDAEARPLCLQQWTQDGGETWVDHTDFFDGGETGWVDFSIFGTSDSGSAGDCEAGTITDTTPLELCPDEEGVFSVGGTQEVPAGHAYGLSFTPTTGTGALEGQFELTGVSLPYTFDADLGGVLSDNSFPPFEGEWEISGIVYDDPNDIANTTCSETTEVLVVNFLTSGDPACDNVGGEPCTDWVDPTPTAGWPDLNNEFGGAPCNDGTGCPFNEIDAFEVWKSEAYALDNCVIGGSYTFSHCNGPGAGSWIPEYTIIAPSGAVDAFGAGDGDGCSITWTASENGTYLIVINEAGACGVDAQVDNGFPAITCNGTPACDGGGDECTDWVNPSPTTGWTDFNGEFGGAPCNDGTGCPFLEIDAFEVWQSEAYAMDNCVAGGSYTFSHCNGSSGSWIPDYTIIAPSGAIDASGAGDGDGCSITWTASEDGTYLIVINEEGACGVEGSTDNGFPAITCNGTPPCDGGGDECTDWVNPSPTTGWSDFNGEFGGAPCNDGTGCPFLEIDAFEVWQSEAYALDNCVAGGSYTFSHCNGASGSWTPDYTIIAPSGAIDASGAGDGDGCSITWTASEDGTYLIVINEEGACGVEGTTDNGFPAITCNGTPPCDGGGDECTDWVNPSPTGGWSDLNDEFGGAPCNDGTGCPFNELDAFEVWESEAYALDNCIAGGSYTFSHCNGPGAGSWIPEYTIIAPSGAIDASGAGDGDGCSITWTASEDGTYLIVINEAGACGVEGSTDNGFPAITCNGTPPCPGPPANDDCANAESIEPGIHDFTTVEATTDGPDQPGSDCDAFEESNVALDVWYEYTASCNGTATMSTCNTANFDTRLAVYPAGTCPPDGSTLIACNDDGVDGEGEDCGDFTSVLEWDIQEGETYLLRLGGFDIESSGSGTFELIEDCITSIDDQEASFSVFPNPNNGQFALEFAGESGLAQIDVLDVSGKSVHSEQRMMTSGSRMDIDLGNVSGMYFVRMTMNNNVQMLKVIVQ